MNKRLPVWVSSIPGGKKCCPLHLERQTKCILMCSCSPSPEPQSAQGIWLERVSLKQMLIIDLFCTPINGRVRLLGRLVGMWSSGENLPGFHIFDRLFTQCVTHLGIIEYWLQLDSLTAQEFNLPPHPHPRPVILHSPRLVPDIS